MKHLLLVGLLTVAVSGTASALEISTSGREAVIPQTGYTGPGFGMKDIAALGTIVAATPILYAHNVMVAVGVGVSTSLLYGAWRTAQYRPQSVKDRMHARLAEQAAVPVAGSVRELLDK